MGYHAFQGLKFDQSTANLMKCYPRKIATGDSFELYSNLTDTYPNLKLIGASHAILNLPTGLKFIINNQSTNAHLFDTAGVHFIAETTTPTAITNYGAIYTKNDNKLYFQDGAGNEHEVSFAP